MNLKQYQEQAIRTCPTLGDIKLDLAHMVLGLHSEYNELLDAYVKEDEVNIVEERGDMMWYLANYCTFRDLNLSEIFDNAGEAIPYFEYQFEEYYTSKLQDLVKKHIAYNKPINADEELSILKDFIISFKFGLDRLNLEDVLQININKLKVRYPDKFTEEKALNRDLDEERKSLQ